MLILLCSYSCSNVDEVEHVNSNVNNSWLNIAVYSCQGDPICPTKSPIQASKLSFFYYEENDSLKEENLILWAYTDSSGQYICTELETNQYYYLKVETPDSLQEIKLIRTDNTLPVYEEFLFP